MSGRWMRGVDAKVGRLLLEAGRADEPAAAKHRALVAATSALAAASVATGSAAGGVGAATGSAAAGKAGIATLVSLKWLVVLGVGVSSVGVVAGAVALKSGASRDASSPATSVIVSPPLRAAASGSALPVARVPSGGALVPAQSSSLTPSPTASPRGAPPRDNPPAPSSSSTSRPSTFSAELSALDHARALLDSGDPAAAVAELDAYAARFPQGVMAPESTLLRIEALIDAGDRAAATRVADDFRGRNPRSPYVTRLRTLLEPPNP